MHLEPYLKDAKMIITCQSELISDISRKELLFGPLDNSTKTPIPDSFLEFVFQPFTDIQISSDLKKYDFVNHPVDLYNHETPVTSHSESW